MRIAYAGHIGVGKSTAAKYTWQQTDGTIWSFGDYVREALTGIGVDPVLIWNEKKTPEVRNLLQALGHGARQIDQDFWVKKFVDEFNSLTPHTVIVDDLRYGNEARALLNLGFKLVWIDPVASIDRDKAPHNHPSEHGLDGWDEWDYKLVADPFDVSRLYKQIDTMLEVFDATDRGKDLAGLA